MAVFSMFEVRCMEKVVVVEKLVMVASGSYIDAARVDQPDWQTRGISKVSLYELTI